MRMLWGRFEGKGAVVTKGPFPVADSKEATPPGSGSVSLWLWPKASIGKFKQDQHKPICSVIEKMKGEQVDPRTGRGYYSHLGMNAVSLFKNRYRSFLELLNLVRNSRTLSFQGGTQK
jgi:hypothetical protein